MKQIQLTKGMVALVDDEDYDELNKHNWCLQGQYAARAKGKKKGEIGGRLTITMHRVIMGLWDKDQDKEVDHINGDKLDNRKENLRICTHSENMRNKKKRNRFGYKGIVKFACNKYETMIWNGKTNIHIGNFPTKEEAAKAYDEAAKKIHGIYAWLNFPDN